MKVYLVYGLDSDDCCEESFVKKAFRDEEKALEYLNIVKKAFRNEEKALEYLNKKAVFPSIHKNWYVQEMELE